jgi:MinD-like ATPase involved in chromosome partitioning or flagellar assembly
MKPIKIILFGPGKGGIGKTAAALCTIPWLDLRKIKYHLLDYDWENTDKSGLKNFHPQATKLNIHSPRAMDEFFDIVDNSATDVVVADLPAGSGEPVFDWFERLYPEAASLGISFTLAAVTTNEAGSVQSTLKWASQLQEKVDYLLIKNELSERNSRFEYWEQEPKAREFTAVFSPAIITMESRPLDLESELRNNSATLDQVARGETNHPYLSRTKNKVRARIAQRSFFEQLDEVTEFLLPRKN